MTIHDKLRFFGACAVLLCAGGVACVAHVDGDDESIGKTTEALILSPAQSTNGYQPYEYSAPNPPTFMTALPTSACFLTGVFGPFQSANDRISIVGASTGPNSPGAWVIEGTRGTGAPRAEVLCDTSHAPMFTTPKTWQQGQASTILTAAAGATCFLTGIQGNFQGNGQLLGDAVRTRIVNGNWVLDGVVGPNSSNITASANCVARGPIAGNGGLTEWSWVSVDQSTGQNTGGMVEMFSAQSSPNKLCALTEVSGRLHGSTIKTYLAGPDPYWYYRLNGTGNVPGPVERNRAVGMKARCIF